MPDFKLSKTYVGPDSPIAAINIKGFKPNSAIKLTDYSDNIVENSDSFNIYERLTSAITSGTISHAGTVFDHDNGALYPVSHYKSIEKLPASSFIVTDRSLDPASTFGELPLFYSYELMFDHYSPYDNPENYIHLRREGDSLVNQDNYMVEFGNSTLAASGASFSRYSRSIRWSNTQSSNSERYRIRLILPDKIERSEFFYDVEYNKSLSLVNTNHYRELVDQRTVYEEGVDYDITSSGVQLIDIASGGKIPPSSILYIKKSFESKVNINPPVSKNDAELDTNWYAWIKSGSFLIPSGIFDTQDMLYTITNDKFDNVSANNPEVIKNETPNILSSRVIQLDHKPLLIQDNGYPNYLISGVPFGETETAQTGGFTININNQQLDNLKDILSVDTRTSTILLTNEIPQAANIEANYIYDSSKSFVIRNMEMNPSIEGSGLFEIEDFGLGYAISPSGSFPSGIVMFKLSDNPEGNFVDIATSGFIASFNPENTGASYGPFTIPPSSIFIGQASVNLIPKDTVKFDDVRRLGGGVSLDAVNAGQESDWWSDGGNWDGKHLPDADAILIQIPSGIQEEFKQKVINNITYDTPDFNELILQGVDPSGQLARSNFESLKDLWATREGNKIIKDIVERHLPIGTKYFIVDENFDFWKMIL